MEYRFERLTKENLGFVHQLYNEVFSSKINREELEGLFDTTIFGKYTIGFLAITEQDEPAAYYGVFPMIAQVEGMQVLVAQSGATMTASQHQKKGLFVQLAQLTFEAASKEGVKLIFGFPNQNSFPGFKNKLNWSFQGDLFKIQKKFRIFPLCEISAKYPVFRLLYASYLKLRLRNRHVSVEDVRFYDSIIIKSKEFLNYKLRNRNVQLISLNGFTFLVKSTPHLLIGDVSRFEQDQLNLFLSTIRQLAKTFLSRKVVFQFSDDHWLCTMLKGEHVTKSLPIGYLILDTSLKIERFSFTFSDLDTF